LIGLRNAFTQGEHFKDLYTNHHKDFLSPFYDPTEYFIRAFPDNPSVMSAYAFMLGTNPQSVEGLGMIQEKNIDQPLRDAHVDDTRRALYLERPNDRAQPVYVHAGNSDGFFFKDVTSMYPGLKRDFDKNLEAASQEFEYKYGSKLFYKLSSLMNVSRGSLNFQNIAQYLDDYVSAYANGKNTAPFEFDGETLDMITEYYTFLIKFGLLRDPALNKVIAHPFLYSLLREVLFKAQDEQEINRWEGPCVSSKISLAFGNRLTYLAALRVLNIDKDVLWNPGWGDQLTFELFFEDGEWYVRIFNNNEIVPLTSRNGNIPLKDFKQYVCSRLYYGDMDAVESGHEDYHQKANIQGGQCENLTKVVPLFGCRKKPEYQYSQSKNTEYGWTQNELRKNDDVRQYGGRNTASDMVFYIRARQASSGYSYQWSSGNQGTDSNSYSGGGTSQAPNQYSYSWSSGSQNQGQQQQPQQQYQYPSQTQSQPQTQNQQSNYGSSSPKPAQEYPYEYNAPPAPACKFDVKYTRICMNYIDIIKLVKCYLCTFYFINVISNILRTPMF
jgi:hypothetical protein